MKSRIFGNGHKSISHNIMQGHPLPTMHIMKKVYPHRIQRLITNAVWHPKTKGWERPNLMCNVVEKTFEGGRKKGMIKWANN
jgi:hypothetical protein